jgi:hypothetical protein
LFGNDVDIDDIMTQGTLLKKIFETAFVSKSVNLGIIVLNDKVIFDGCKAKSFCKQKYKPDKSCRCSSKSINLLSVPCVQTQRQQEAMTIILMSI